MSDARKRVPQANPGAVYDTRQTELDAALRRVLASGRYVLDAEVLRFEHGFAAYVGVAHGIGVASGTDALELALRACGVAADDLVLAPSFAPSATGAAVLRCGAQLVLVDVAAESLTLDPRALEDALAACTRATPGRRPAIVPVHLFGCPAEMAAILEIARRWDAVVVEDCCQAHGASIRGQRVGTFGHAAAYSFYPTKNLGCFGDGGMVVTDDPEVDRRVRLLRQYGWRERYSSEQFGTNSRLDELHAAVLSALLPHLDQRNAQRARIAARYAAAAHQSLRVQQAAPNAVHVYHQFVVRTPERAELRRWLEDHGVETAIHYPASLHQQPLFAAAALAPLPLTVSATAAAHVLSLPLYPELPPEHVDRITALLDEWCSSTVAPLA